MAKDQMPMLEQRALEMESDASFTSKNPLLPDRRATTADDNCHSISSTTPDSWCMVNCNWTPSNCPPALCSCNSPHEDPTAQPTDVPVLCSKGLLDRGNTVCCSGSCSQCGGSGCGAAGENCCTSNIKKSQKMCMEPEDTECMIPRTEDPTAQPTEDPTADPTSSPIEPTVAPTAKPDVEYWAVCGKPGGCTGVTDKCGSAGLKSHII